MLLCIIFKYFKLYYAICFTDMHILVLFAYDGAYDGMYNH